MRRNEPSITRVMIAGYLVMTSTQAWAAGPDAQVSPSPAGVSPAVESEIEGDARRFVEIGGDFRGELNTYVRTELQAKKERLEDAMNRAVAVEDNALTERRLSAIAYYEAFLERYPNHPEHTADAMFRLAELYFEKGAVDMERFSTDPAAAASLGDADPMDVAFDDAIRLYTELNGRFPAYRHADASHYVLGYLYEETGRPELAVQAFLALVNQHPKSRYAAESYLRLGEIYFDAADWDQAARAYESALAFEDSRFYDKALYKLAWTQFQRFDYDQAIRLFKDLIALYDEKVGGATAGESKALATELRSEAVEYLARSLAEDDWDGDGELDANAGVERAWSYLNAGKPYEREVLDAYANALYELHEEPKYLQAVDVLERLVGREPDHPSNPALMERVVAIFDIVGQREAAAARRSQLISRFNPKSSWYKANKGRHDVLAHADEMVELAMRQEAQIEHRAAQDLRKAALASEDKIQLVAAADAYGRAAEAYKAYLDAFPKSKYAADMEYFLGETLFFTGRFLAAADVYERVRDAESQEQRYLEPAAYSAVKALEQAIALDAAEGRLPPEASPTAELADEPDTIPSEMPIPPLVERWIRAVDAYGARGLSRTQEPDAAARFQYQVALVLSRLGAVGSARQRAEQLVSNHQQSEIAGYAATLIIDSYRKANDWDNIEKWARIVEEQGIGRPGDQAKLRDEIRTFKLGAQFQRAELLLEEKKYVEAAQEFERIVDEDSAGSLTFADKALYNAALAYEMAQRYDSAARVFERVVTEPRFAESPYVEDATFRLAENHNRFFDFERAVSRYLSLVDRNPKHAQAPYALFEAAHLREKEGKFRDAAVLYERYHRAYGDRNDAPSALFRAAQSWEKAGKSDESDRVNQAVVTLYDAVPSVAPLIVHATLNLANSALAARKKDEAARLFQSVIAEFKKRGLQEGTTDAAFPAEAQFRLVELKYEEYKAIKLKGSLAAMGRQIKRKQTLLAELEAAYAETFPYRALDWTFAAYFRIGQIYEDFASTIYEAPEPEGLSAEELEVYQLELEDIGVRYEDTAVARYETTVQKARELKYKNQWTELALKSVNRYRPAEYPLQREPLRALVFFPFLERVTTDDGAAAVAPSPEAEATP